MRIEINAGGISGAITVLQFQAAASKHLEKSNDVISAFVTVQRKTSQIEGQTPRLQEAQAALDERVQIEENRKAQVERVKQGVEDFLSHTVETDARVSNCVSQNTEKFYQVNPWLRPPQEKWYQRWYENAEKFLIGAVDKVIDQVAKVWKCAVEFYHKNQKLIHSIATALEAIAVIAFAFVTGGIALFPILVAVINLVSAGMEIWSTWNEDNPLANSVGFKAIKMGVDTLALVTKILVWPAAEGVKLSGLLGRLFPVMSGFDIAKDLTKSVFFFVVDGAILNMDRNANTSVDFVKDIDEINGVKDTAENLIQSFST